MRSMSIKSGCILLIYSAATSSFGSNRSIGQDGINSVDIPRSGSGVGIGQVEVERPGSEGTDPPLLYNTYVEPEAVFLRDGNAVGTMDVEPGHATEVASVMISTDENDPDMDGDNPRGVAIAAELYASATRVLDEELTAVSAQHVANQNLGDVSAINFSFVHPNADPLDGSSLLTQFVDWSTRAHEVLYVIGGTQTDNEGFVLPGDNFNGVTVAMSTFAADGVYRRVDSRNRNNQDALGDRTSVDLIAPGDDIEVDTILSAQSNAQALRDGTSFAAPHVTGTIALLQEEAKTMSVNAQRHEVMKAVLLNSADKVKGIIGMERTVLKKSDTPETEEDDDDWFDTTAHSDPNIPLDIEMGAGHLNASRAYEQLTAGEHSPGGVPLKGWDYLVNDDPFSPYRYTLNLNVGDFVSATLIWDREVELNAPFPEYEPGDEFVDFGFENLDLYLVPAGFLDVEQGIANAVASSISSVENLEHIFESVPTAGPYEIWVKMDVNSITDVPFALAWWAGPDTRDQTAQGDYNSDGNVNAADYVTWRKNNGSSMEYDEWVENFGSSSGSGSGVSVPEPSVMLQTIALVSIGASICRRSRCRTVDQEQGC